MSSLLITGATGFVWGHLGQGCVRRGAGERVLAVRVLSRPGADVSLLRGLGVEPFEADLTQPQGVSAVVEGVESIVHCAAKVGDWGAVEEYRRGNVGGGRGRAG